MTDIKFLNLLERKGKVRGQWKGKICFLTHFVEKEISFSTFKMKFTDVF